MILLESSSHIFLLLQISEKCWCLSHSGFNLFIFPIFSVTWTTSEICLEKRVIKTADILDLIRSGTSADHKHLVFSLLTTRHVEFIDNSFLPTYYWNYSGRRCKDSYECCSKSLRSAREESRIHITSRHACKWGDGKAFTSILKVFKTMLATLRQPHDTQIQQDVQGWCNWIGERTRELFEAVFICVVFQLLEHKNISSENTLEACFFFFIYLEFEGYIWLQSHRRQIGAFHGAMCRVHPTEWKFF